MSLVASVPLAAASQQAPKISQAQLESMFANMRATAPWNVDGPLLWGFFFIDADKSRLESAASELASRGYRVVDISPTKGGSELRLHVERVEALTPTTLYARDIEFEALARKYRIRSYDGMDVGPAPSHASAPASAASN